MPAIYEIENRLRELVKIPDPRFFPQPFFSLYGLPKTTVNSAKRLGGSENNLVARQRFIYVTADNGDAANRLDALIADEQSIKKYQPRFLIATDYVSFQAYDLKRKARLETAFTDLPKSYEFFFPWLGIEANQIQQENPADMNAAEKMAKIYDEIVKKNPDLAEKNPHVLNVFLTRLLFCYFAEDTGIFPGENLFTQAVSGHTDSSGSDTADYLAKVFETFDMKKKGENCPNHLRRFPYVNGSLFTAKLEIPKISADARQLIMSCGELDWHQINPDIFGSMFQAVASKEVRGTLGQHYTSVSNIMKVIEPLFIDELKEEFQKARENSRAELRKLKELRERISEIRIFDPACGSGNFLIIAYKQLRNLEIEILQRIRELEKRKGMDLFSAIRLENFYGIEIDDFACEIARLSLWLAEHQMNVKFRDIFGEQPAPLPLKPTGNILHGNAARIDWESVCPKTENGKELEVYLLGNPPYLGRAQQNAEQKTDKDIVFNGLQNYKNLDYIACWFYKASQYISDSKNARYAFVSTNSICQGQQANTLWDKVLFDDLEIFFAHQSFKWTNNAKRNAGVTCIIVGIGRKANTKKRLFTEKNEITVKSINPYLKEDKDSIEVKSRNESLSCLPKMCFGDMPYDGGNLILTTQEKDQFLSEHPAAQKFIRMLLGSKEFIRGEQRWCLWIHDEDLAEAETYEFIKTRIQKTRNVRLASRDAGGRRLAARPHQFRDLLEAKKSSLIIPCVSSERREYIPIGFLDNNTIISNLAFAVYDPPLWIFGLLTSRMHMVWMRAVAGRLESRYRYSNTLVYNTFPFPSTAADQQKQIERCVRQIMKARAGYTGKTMAELYDPDKMPYPLREAHEALDLCIDRCYQPSPFENDEARLAYLFALYETMTAAESGEGKNQ